MVVYDITCLNSFQNIEKEWLRILREYAQSDVELILVGNKCDLDDGERQVPTEHGERLAAKYGMRFMETSAKSNTNINEAFLMLVSAINTKKMTNAMQL